MTTTAFKYEYGVSSIGALIGDESLEIPEHQRGEMWNFKRQESLIETIMLGHPMPNLMRRAVVVDGCIIHYLEDGHQRYITMKKFNEGNLVWKGRRYADLTEHERMHFHTYTISMLTYRGGTIADVIRIFDVIQNGVPLNPGQRFHSRINTPLVKYARQIITPGTQFYARITSVFGAHNYAYDTISKKMLMNAMALAGGAAHGINFITTSYDILGPKLMDEFDEAVANNRIDKVLCIFERADALKAITLQQQKKQWNVGQLTGYILASLVKYPEDADVWSDKWVSYICDIRDGTSSIDILHYNKPASRNWNEERWRIGLENINNPPERIASEDSPSDDE